MPAKPVDPLKIVRGTMRKMFEVVCFDCGDAIVIDVPTAKEAKAEAREQHDWSLGRDKEWRCGSCRSPRFGERL